VVTTAGAVVGAVTGCVVVVGVIDVEADVGVPPPAGTASTPPGREPRAAARARANARSAAAILPSRALIAAVEAIGCVGAGTA